jgi:hypothetical protein
MTKPLTKKFLGGTFKFVAKGDSYKDPVSGNEVLYEHSKVVLNTAGVKIPAEISKDAWLALVKFMQDDEVSLKLKDWV